MQYPCMRPHTKLKTMPSFFNYTSLFTKNPPAPFLGFLPASTPALHLLGNFVGHKIQVRDARTQQVLATGEIVPVRTGFRTYEGAVVLHTAVPSLPKTTLTTRNIKKLSISHPHLQLWIEIGSGMRTSIQ